MKARRTILLVCTILSIILLAACGGKKEEGITVENVTLAKNLDENYQPVDPTTQFGPTDIIYVSVEVKGRPETGIITGKFYYGDQYISEASVDLSSVNEGVIVSIGENTYIGFNLTPSTSWPVDSGYSFKLYIDNVEFGTYAYEVVQ
ncbi:MAG: hypothetical protein GYA45_01020 [Pelolinea sp.]|jgi:uncharacterized protein YpuA (DUF1002 family)|nr:hypothetical protein [Pelolinea sp.]